ncbi:hypothetical protein KM043_008337 [Ampulex compressa]|nr:hypothetical protein KM043_008337 [Ampulex compressa]
MGRWVTWCTAETTGAESQTDPPVVFAPTDLSILARCVTNVYVTTRKSGGSSKGNRGKKERKRKAGTEEGRRTGRELWRTEPRAEARSSWREAEPLRLNYC